MNEHEVTNVTGIPFTFRNGSTVLASVDSVDSVRCWNEVEDDNPDDRKPGSLYLYFKTTIRLTSRGFHFTGRAMSIRASAKLASGNDVGGNPNELLNVLFLPCGYSNEPQNVVFKCRDFTSGGCAAGVVLVHFSFLHDPTQWAPC